MGLSSCWKNSVRATLSTPIDPELFDLARLFLVDTGSLAYLLEGLGETRAMLGEAGKGEGPDGAGKPLINCVVLFPPVSSGRFSIVSTASIRESEGESGR